MAGMNGKRVLLGGLVAGLIMNVSEFVLHGIVLAPDGAKLLEDWNQMGLHVEPSPTLLMWLIAATFALGILAVWTYAAIRPRFGAGPKTALCAGLAVWTLSYLYAGVYVYAGIVVVPAKLVWLPVAWSLIEVPLATLAGAFFYKE